jgi:hypothetical protein
MQWQQMIKCQKVLKIEMNSGMIIYNSSWIAEVDYDNDDENKYL